MAVLPSQLNVDRLRGPRRGRRGDRRRRDEHGRGGLRRGGGRGRRGRGLEGGCGRHRPHGPGWAPAARRGPRRTGCSVTTVPAGTWVPAAGSVRTTVPAGRGVMAPSGESRRRGPQRRARPAALPSVRPVRSGTATRAGAGTRPRGPVRTRTPAWRPGSRSPTAHRPSRAAREARWRCPARVTTVSRSVDLAGGRARPPAR